MSPLGSQEPAPHLFVQGTENDSPSSSYPTDNIEGDINHDIRQTVENHQDNNTFGDDSLASARNRNDHVESWLMGIPGSPPPYSELTPIPVRG